MVATMASTANFGLTLMASTRDTAARPRCSAAGVPGGVVGQRAGPIGHVRDGSASHLIRPLDSSRASRKCVARSIRGAVERVPRRPWSGGTSAVSQVPDGPGGAAQGARRACRCHHPPPGRCAALRSRPRCGPRSAPWPPLPRWPRVPRRRRRSATGGIRARAERLRAGPARPDRWRADGARPAYCRPTPPRSPGRRRFPSAPVSTCAMAVADGVTRATCRQRDRSVTAMSSGPPTARTAGTPSTPVALDDLRQRVGRTLRRPVGVLDHHDLPAPGAGPARRRLDDGAHLHADGRALRHHPPDVAVGAGHGGGAGPALAAAWTPSAVALQRRGETLGGRRPADRAAR